MSDLAILAGLSAAGSLALGVPLRLFGWRAVLAGVRTGLAFIRSHRWKLLLILLIGAAAGLWNFDTVRELAFGFFVR